MLLSSSLAMSPEVRRNKRQLKCFWKLGRSLDLDMAREFVASLVESSIILGKCNRFCYSRDMMTSYEALNAYIYRISSYFSHNFISPKNLQKTLQYLLHRRQAFEFFQSVFKRTPRPPSKFSATPLKIPIYLQTILNYSANSSNSPVFFLNLRRAPIRG